MLKEVLILSALAALCASVPLESGTSKAVAPAIKNSPIVVLPEAEAGADLDLETAESAHHRGHRGHHRGGYGHGGGGGYGGYGGGFRGPPVYPARGGYGGGFGGGFGAGVGIGVGVGVGVGVGGGYGRK